MSWKMVKLGDFLKVRDDRFKPNDKAISHLKRIEKIDFSGEIFISDKPSNTDMILVKKGDLVISGINVEKGAMAVYTGKEDIIATIHYSSYSFDENRIDIDFLKFFLKSIEFKNALKEQVPGGIKTEIKPKHLLPLVVNIPTNIKDQKAVVNILKARNSKVEALSTELTHQLTLVKKLRQQLLQDAVQGKLVAQDPGDEPAGELLKRIKAEKQKLMKEGKLKKEKELPAIKAEEIPFEVPEGWVWCRLGEVSLNSEAGKSFKCTEVPISDNEWGVVKVSAVSWDYFLEDNNKLYSKTQPNDISAKIESGDFLISRANTSELVGKSVVVKAISKNLLLSDKIIRFNFPKAISKEYINLCNNNKYARIYYSAMGTGSSPSMKNITRVHMNNLLIPIPPLSEQGRIVQKLEELMGMCEALEVGIGESVKQNERLLGQVLREALKEGVVEKVVEEV